MKNSLLIIFIFSLSFPTIAKVCVDKSKVSFVAFKTPAKVGVGGELKGASVTSELCAKSPKSLLKNASLEIDGTSVFTKNPARDKKIASFFFGSMEKGPKITAKVKTFKKKYVIVEIKMNGVSKDVPMKYELGKKSIKASGIIDILDFSMSKSLKAINKACFALHEGKTWSDVEISADISLK